MGKACLQTDFGKAAMQSSEIFLDRRGRISRFHSLPVCVREMQRIGGSDGIPLAILFVWLYNYATKVLCETDLMERRVADTAAKPLQYGKRGGKTVSSRNALVTGGHSSYGRRFKHSFFGKGDENCNASCRKGTQAACSGKKRVCRDNVLKGLRCRSHAICGRI